MQLSNYENGLSSQEVKLKSRSWVFFFILFIFAFGFAIYYFSEIKKEIKFLESVNPFWLLIAIGAQFLTYFFAAVINRWFLAALKLQYLPGLGDLLKTAIISLFFNQTIPSAGISGNIFFFNYLSKLNVKFSQIISIILIELLVFYIAMDFLALVLLITGLLYYNTPHAIDITLLVGILIYLVYFTLIILLGRQASLEFLFRKIQAVKLLSKMFRSVLEKIRQQPVSTINMEFRHLLKSNIKLVIQTFLGQLLIIFADGLTLYALFYGLKIHVSPFVVLLVLVSTKIVSLIPFLPGSLVLYESSMSLFFSTMGVPLGTAVIATMVYRLLSFWFPMPIGLFLYRKWLKITDVMPSPPA